MKQYFPKVSMDFDNSFNYEAMKEFLYSAAGMFKDLDMDIFNKNLVQRFQVLRGLDRGYSEFRQKSEYVFNVYTNSFLCAQANYVEIKKEYDTLKDQLQDAMLRETFLEKEIKLAEDKLQIKLNEKKISKDSFELEMNTLKPKRREHVDTIHSIGEKKQRLIELFSVISNFENENKSLFVEIFEEYKERLDYQYNYCLNFFGADFSNYLFLSSERSMAIKKFKRDANIIGDITICKFYEYYSKNINPDSLSDMKMKERLKIAKNYCENHKSKEVEF